MEKVWYTISSGSTKIPSANDDYAPKQFAIGEVICKSKGHKSCEYIKLLHPKTLDCVRELQRPNRVTILFTIEILRQVL